MSGVVQWGKRKFYAGWCAAPLHKYHTDINEITTAVCDRIHVLVPVIWKDVWISKPCIEKTFDKEVKDKLNDFLEKRGMRIGDRQLTNRGADSDGKNFVFLLVITPNMQRDRFHVAHFNCLVHNMKLNFNPFY